MKANLLKNVGIQLSAIALFLSLSFGAQAQVPNQDSSWMEFFMDSHMMLISEILFDPVKDGADYVEIYNSTLTDYPCDSFYLVRWIGDSLGKRHPLPTGRWLPAGEYVVLTTDTAFVLSHYHVAHPENLMQMASMPPYPNDTGTVLLYANGDLLQDRVDYNKQMHSPLLRDKEGVALERGQLSLKTSDPTNWHSASSTVGYGTPTTANSQADPYYELSVELSSPTLSPDGDGYQDDLEISILSPKASLSCNATICDAQGRPVRRLLRNAIIGTHETLLWDGRNDSGQLCPRGTYIILLEVYDHHGLHLAKKLAVSLLT